MKLLFGLEQQGHIPTIKRMRVEQKSWEEIAKAIGWEELGLIKAYMTYLEKEATKVLASQIVEHSTVKLISDESYHGLKAGDTGTVVHVYRDLRAFEVEFPGGQVITVDPKQIEKVEDSNGYS